MMERRNYGMTVALVNNKGGLGKTTSAVNLPAGVAAGLPVSQALLAFDPRSSVLIIVHL